MNESIEWEGVVKSTSVYASNFFFIFRDFIPSDLYHMQ